MTFRQESEGAISAPLLRTNPKDEEFLTNVAEKQEMI